MPRRIREPSTPRRSAPSGRQAVPSPAAASRVLLRRRQFANRGRHTEASLGVCERRWIGRRDREVLTGRGCKRGRGAGTTRRRAAKAILRSGRAAQRSRPVGGRGAWGWFSGGGEWAPPTRARAGARRSGGGGARVISGPSSGRRDGWKEGEPPLLQEVRL